MIEEDITLDEKMSLARDGDLIAVEGLINHIHLLESIEDNITYINNSLLKEIDILKEQLRNRDNIIQKACSEYLRSLAIKKSETEKRNKYGVQVASANLNSAANSLLNGEWKGFL